MFIVLMENILKKIIFKLEGFNIGSTDIINNHIIIFDKNNDKDIKYKIINYLGKGTVGQVYLLEPVNFISENNFVIKISNPKCQEDLKKEVELVEYYFNKYNIKHRSYPIFWGNFNNLNAIGAIYPFLGFYNLEKIKKIQYKINWENNIQIIIQLINQLIGLKNIIHGDLKSSNVVIDIIKNSPLDANDKIIATIIDFGLIKKKTSKTNIISTNYITSPESLLSLEKYSKCVNSDETVNLSKHDYYGLFTIILDMFLKKGFWRMISSYLINQVKISSNYITKHEAIDIFGYSYYKIFYENHNDLPHNFYKKLIYKIEVNYPTISTKEFYNFDTFFRLYIEPNIDYTIFNSNNLVYFKDFLIKICHLDPDKRLELDELLIHPFLTGGGDC